MRSFSLVLPMPPSLNKMHVFGKGGKVVARSSEYKDWIQYAGVSFRKQFPRHPEPLTGRLRVQYMFIFTTFQHLASDTFNREKCLSDFLEGIFFENDNMIDEGMVYKRIGTPQGKNRVRIWLEEIEDLRIIDDAGCKDAECLP